MMAFIQILAIVLCSCFIQDAFSTTRVRRVTSTPAASQSADAGGQVAPPLTGAGGQVAPAASQLTSAGGQVAAKPTVRRTRTVKRTASGQPTTAPAAPPPPPPAKYSHLTALKDMFWNTIEETNQASENGKLIIRSLRNMMSNVLSNQLFWTSVVGALKRRVKVTNDSKRADSKIRMCNALTATITSPYAVQGFQDVANEVYGTVSRMQSDVGTGALRLVTEMVDGGEVTRGLDTVTDIVNKIKLSPRMLVKGFAMFRKTLNLGGAISMGGGLARGLMTFTSKFNK